MSSEPGRGTTFRICLPRHTGRPSASPAAAAASDAECGTARSCSSRTSRRCCESARRELEKLGYQVLTAATPGEALRLAREHVGDIELLMTDVVMPEMNGRDLARNLLSLYPEVRCLFTSGYTADVIAHHGVLDEGVHFLQKPFSQAELAAKVREALGGA